MKYIFTRKNLKWNTNFGDIKSFSTIEERDAFVNEELMNDGEDYRAILTTTIDTVNINLNPVENTAQMVSNQYKTNMVIMMDELTGDITFHHINDFSKYEQEALTSYTLTKSLWLSNIGVLESLENFRMTKGHSKITDYENYEFDNGSYKINGINPLRRKNGKEQNSFIIAFEKINNATAGILIGNNSSDALEQPYRVLIAPVEPIEITDANIPAQTILDNGSTSKGEDNTNQYLKRGNTISVVFPLLESNKIDIKFSFLSYFRTAIIPTWNYRDATGTVNLEDIWDQERLYHLAQGDDGNILDLIDNLDSADYTLGQGEEIGIGAISDRVGQLVAIKFNPLTNELTIRDALYQDYNNRSNKNYKLIKTSNYINADNGYWTSDKPDNQWDWFNKGTEGTNYNQVSIDKITVKAQTTSIWTNRPLINYLNSGNATNVIAVKEYNYDFLIESLSINNFGNIDNVSSIDVEYGGENIQIQKLDFYYFDITTPSNQYEAEIDIENENQTINLKGNELFKIGIENIKDFNIPQEFIIKTDNGVKIDFNHYVFLTPTSQDERIRFNNESNSINIFTDENVWDNNREALTPSNQFAEFNNNNPINAPLQLLSPLSKPATYLKPVSSFGQALGTIANRQNMKKAPESIKGSGDIYSNIYFNKVKNKFALKTINYLGSEWLSTITDIYREGLQFNTPNYIKNFESIKRPKFNFIQLENFREANKTYDLFEKEIEAYEQAFQEGVRVWNDGFKEYSETLEDNGDK